MGRVEETAVDGWWERRCGVWEVARVKVRDGGIQSS